MSGAMLLLYCTVTQSSLGLVGLKSHPKAVGDATIGFLTTVLILVSRGGPLGKEYLAKVFCFGWTCQRWTCLQCSAMAPLE